MLILSRREREQIKLGDAIVVTVVRVDGRRVRLGIEAPSDVVILRQELEPEKTPDCCGSPCLPEPPGGSTGPQDRRRPPG